MCWYKLLTTHRVYQKIPLVAKWWYIRFNTERLTDCNTLTCRRWKSKKQLSPKQECSESYLLSRLPQYNTLGMKFLSSCGGKTKSFPRVKRVLALNSWLEQDTFDRAAERLQCVHFFCQDCIVMAKTALSWLRLHCHGFVRDTNNIWPMFRCKSALNLWLSAWLFQYRPCAYKKVNLKKENSRKMTKFSEKKRNSGVCPSATPLP